MITIILLLMLLFPPRKVIRSVAFICMFVMMMIVLLALSDAMLILATLKQKIALVNSTTWDRRYVTSVCRHNRHTHETYRTRDMTGRAWFSRLLRHPVRKRRGSILSTPEPARDTNNTNRIYIAPYGRNFSVRRITQTVGPDSGEIF